MTRTSGTASRTVAVIDIGSNTIKVLVAERAGDGGVRPLKFRTVDARISTGISATTPRLTEEGMGRALEAIQFLLREAKPFAPARVELVATSAVRDAQNGPDFRKRVRTASGHDIRILTGDEEANLIGRGLTCDPALRGWRDFYVFDLGGGSLECLAFRGRKIEKAISTQLGCVRLTEKFVANPEAPIGDQELAATSDHVKEILATAGFSFGLPKAAGAIATGGTITTVRGILGAREEKPLELTSPVISVGQLRTLLTEIGSLPLPQRKAIAGLPPGRADVFPVALATFVAIAEAGNFSEYRNSVFSLRFGIADELLAARG